LWYALYEMIEEEDQKRKNGTKGISDKLIANRYNRRYASSISLGKNKKKKASPKIVARVRHEYRKRVVNTTELTDMASGN
jgi:hypothetical protein